MRALLCILLTTSLASAALPQKAPRIPQAPTQTLCDCASTGKCLCYAGECACPACNKTAKEVPSVKAPKSSTTQITPARAAAIRPQPVQEHGSSEDTLPAATYTLVPGVGLSGCTNGNCPNVTSPRRARR